MPVETVGNYRAKWYKLLGLLAVITGLVVLPMAFWAQSIGMVALFVLLLVAAIIALLAGIVLVSLGAWHT